MKKIINYIMLMVLGVLFVGIGVVKAATMTVEDVKITGKNLFGQKLYVEKGKCLDSSSQEVSCLASYQWYSSDTGSVTDGVAISGATSFEYTIDQSLVGKYIYVIVTFSATGYDNVAKNDVTDSKNNIFDKVSNYILKGTEKPSISTTTEYKVGAELKMVLNGLSEESTDDLIRVYFSDDDKSYAITEDATGCGLINEKATTVDVAGFHGVEKNTNRIQMPGQWNLFNKYKTAYVYKYNYNTHICYTYDPISLNKVSLPDYDKRYTYFFFSDSSISSSGISVYPMFPYSKNSDTVTNFVTKIGEIKDTNILKKFKNINDNAQELLSYIKDASGETFGSSIKSGSPSNDGKNMSVTDGAYYFVYTKIVDDNNEYVNTEGITVALGKAGILSTSFDWDVDDAPTAEPQAEPEQKKQEPIENPDTGSTISIVALIIGTIIAIILVVKGSNKFYRI